MQKILTFITSIFLLGVVNLTIAHEPRLVYLQSGNIQINNPEISQAFYDELKGKPRDYFIESENDFELYVNLLVPETINREGRYSAKIFLIEGSSADSGQAEKQIDELDARSVEWREHYDNFEREYYLKGPELSKQLSAGRYKIEVFSLGLSQPGEAETLESSELSEGAGNADEPAKSLGDNQGKYVLKVGKTSSKNIGSILNIYWQLPFLKITFLKTSVLQFFLTPFGIAGVGAFGLFLVILALLYYLAGTIRETIKHNQAKTLLLTSNGMQMKEEIVKLLQKPAYDITVAFISTAAKPVENLDYLKKDWAVMRDEMGFNVEEIDIEGKRESEVMRLLELKDIIFVEGGNTFYLLKAMRACHFERIIRRLLKDGKVYIGASAGSIVAGRTIKTAGWKNGDKNIVKLRNLRGLNLVPFDIFVHFQPEHAEIIQKNMPWRWQRRKKLRILTDEQAILVQGREIMLIGKGTKIVI